MTFAPAMPAMSAREQLLERLRRLAKAGIAPNALALLPEQHLLVDKVIAEFGSLAVARMEMQGRRRRDAEFDTPTSVTAALKHLRSAGQRLAPRRLRQLGEEQLVRAVYAHFGSFAHARTAAGLPPHEPPVPRPDPVPTMTRDEALSAYKDRFEADPDVLRDDLPHELVRALDHHVGGVAAARELLEMPTRRWSHDRVIGALAERLRSGEDVSTEALMAEGRSDVVNAIYRHVGSAVEARAKAEAALGHRPGAVARRKQPASRGPTSGLLGLPRATSKPLLPGRNANVTARAWKEFLSRCKVAADRGAGPPHELSILVPGALLAGLHAQVTAAGPVLIKLIKHRAGFLEISAPRADHLMLAGIVNALECAGVKVPPPLATRCRGWVTLMAPSPATVKAVTLARLVAAHQMSASAADRQSAHAMLREREVSVEPFLSTLVSRRHRNGDHPDWLNLVRSALDERQRELDPIELLWAARVRYHHLEGIPVRHVAEHLARDMAG